MDFTGSQGRIVDDPLEAMAIEAAEGHIFKNRWRKPIRQTEQLRTDSITTLDGRGIDTNLPWYHTGIGREEARRILSQCDPVDG